MMKNFHDLNLGYVDAENYLKRENKDLFNKFFYKDSRLDEILFPSTYFLIGEKGTGKTAYAVFLSNNEYKETRSVLKYIRETDYIKFLEMKKHKALSFSDYSYVWKVILCLLVLKTLNTPPAKAGGFTVATKVAFRLKPVWPLLKQAEVIPPQFGRFHLHLPVA